VTVVVQIDLADAEAVHGGDDFLHVIHGDGFGEEGIGAAGILGGEV